MGEVGAEDGIQHAIRVEAPAAQSRAILRYRLAVKKVHNGTLVYVTRRKFRQAAPVLIAQNDPVLVEREMKPTYEVHAQDHIEVSGTIGKAGKAKLLTHSESLRR